MPTSRSPLIKWPGSKGPVLRGIASLLPARPPQRAIDPFCGGGWFTAWLAPRVAARLAGDVYAPLVALWGSVRDDPQARKDAYRQRWESLQRLGADFYYAVRDRYNAAPSPDDLLFLSRACYNGLFRLSRAGKFNVSFHHGRRGVKPASLSRQVDAWSESLAGVSFFCGDYEGAAEPQAGDLWLLDPPYRWGERGMYQGAFDGPRFVRFLRRLSAAGSLWLLTLDPPTAAMVSEDVASFRHALAAPPSAHSRLRSGSHVAVSHVVLCNYTPPQLGWVLTGEAPGVSGGV